MDKKIEAPSTNAPEADPNRKGHVVNAAASQYSETGTSLSGRSCPMPTAQLTAPPHGSTDMRCDKPANHFVSTRESPDKHANQPATVSINATENRNTKIKLHRTAQGSVVQSCAELPADIPPRLPLLFNVEPEAAVRIAAPNIEEGSKG